MACLACGLVRTNNNTELSIDTRDRECPHEFEQVLCGTDGKLMVPAGFEIIAAPRHEITVELKSDLSDPGSTDEVKPEDGGYLYIPANPTNRHMQVDVWIDYFLNITLDPPAPFVCADCVDETTVPPTTYNFTADRANTASVDIMYTYRVDAEENISLFADFLAVGSKTTEADRHETFHLLFDQPPGSSIHIVDFGLKLTASSNNGGSVKADSLRIVTRSLITLSEIY